MYPPLVACSPATLSDNIVTPPLVILMLPPATCKEFGDPVRFVTVIPLANVSAPLAPEIVAPANDGLELPTNTPAPPVSSLTMPNSCAEVVAAN